MHPTHASTSEHATPSAGLVRGEGSRQAGRAPCHLGEGGAAPVPAKNHHYAAARITFTHHKTVPRSQQPAIRATRARRQGQPTQ